MLGNTDGCLWSFVATTPGFSDGGFERANPLQRMLSPAYREYFDEGRSPAVC